MMTPEELARKKKVMAKIRRKKRIRRRIIAFSITGILLILIIFGIVKLIGAIIENNEDVVTPVQIGPEFLQNDVVPAYIKPYDYYLPVPETTEISADLSNSIILGDFRVAGLELYYPGSIDIAYNDNVKMTAALESSFSGTNGQSLDIEEVFVDKKYDNIYLFFGVNELQGVQTPAFYTAYMDFVTHIKTLQPDSDIYLLNLVSVSQNAIDTTEAYYADKINAVNSLIKDVAVAQKVYYIDIDSVLSPDGVLLEQFDAGNGIGLNPDAYEQLLEYIKSHIVIKENYA